MAKLPTGVSRIDRRGVDRPAAVGSDEEERLAAGPGRKRAPRMMGLNRCAILAGKGTEAVPRKPTSLLLAHTVSAHSW